MPRETLDAKAARLFLADRWRLVREQTNPYRLTLDVLGDSADPMQPKPYRVTIEFTDTGLHEECGCANPKNCSHLTLARRVSHGIGVPRPR